MSTPRVTFSPLNEAVSGLGEDASIDVYLDGVYIGSLSKTRIGSMWSGTAADERFTKAFNGVAGRNIVRIKGTLQQALISTVHAIPPLDSRTNLKSKERRYGGWKWLWFIVVLVAVVALFRDCSENGGDVEPITSEAASDSETGEERWDDDLSESDPDSYGYRRYRSGSTVNNDGYLASFSCTAYADHVGCELVLDYDVNTEPPAVNFWDEKGENQSLRVAILVDGEPIETHVYIQEDAYKPVVRIENASKELISAFKDGINIEVHTDNGHDHTVSTNFSAMGFTAMHRFVSGLKTIEEQEADLKAKNPNKETYAEQQQRESHESAMIQVEWVFILEGLSDFCSETAKLVVIRGQALFGEPDSPSNWYAQLISEESTRSLHSLNVYPATKSFAKILAAYYKQGQIIDEFSLYELCGT